VDATKRAVENAPKRYRTLFLSDIHLATRATKSDHLLSFLKDHDAAAIYLVGDVFDFWRIRRSPRWRASQTGVVQELLAKAKAGSRLIYIPGNHDSEMRHFAGTRFGPLEVQLSAIHETAAGRRFLVMHGDELDVVMRKARWLAVVGDIAYDLALAFNTLFNAARRRLGLRYWSISAYLKYRVKRAVNYIGNFEQLLADEARKAGATGVICGHIHHASIQEIGGILYVNTGDWVESGTAVAEHADGRLEMIRWIETSHDRRAAKETAPQVQQDAVL
jgi:UDP-2,3-diacylglucosamine pyrophosphatase LpxH